MPRLKAEEIQNIVTTKDKSSFIRNFIKGCKEEDPVQLSDLLANKNDWGGHVLQILGGMEGSNSSQGIPPMKWKIKAIRDEWGNKLTVGDKVIKKIKVNLKDDDGKPVDPNVISRAILDGSYEEKFIFKKKFPIDKKGCIECGFEDAVHFLNVWGLHSTTGRTLTSKPEMSREPEDCPNGQKLHAHYWRFKEMTTEQYDKLPQIKKRDYLLRGIDEIELINAQKDDDKTIKEVKAEKRKQEIIKEANK